MRTWPALALLIALTPSAAADANLALGPVAVGIERDEPATCAIPGDLPCFAWHDQGDDPGVGDDEIILYQALLRASVEAMPPAGPTVHQDLDLRNTALRHPVFERYSALDASLDAATPGVVATWFDLDMDEDGIAITEPRLNYDTGAVEPRRGPFMDWNDEFVNYTHVHAPYNTYPRSLGNTLYLPWTQTCAFPFALGEHACDVRILHATVGAVEEEVPDVVLGAELHRVAAGTAPTPGGSGIAPVNPRWSTPDITPARGERPRPTHEATHEPVRGIEPWPSFRSDVRGPSSDPGALGSQSAQASVPSQAAGFSLAVVAALSAALLLVAALYHRLLGPKVLDHPVRQAIRHYVAHHPGCDVASIAAHVGLDYKTVQHHLAILRRSGLVTLSRVGRRTMLHLDGEAGAALHHFATRNALRQRVVWMVETTPGVRQSHVARELGVTRSTLHAHVALLQRAGLIVNEKGRLRPVPRAVPTDSAGPALVEAHR